ncbi:MAG TPA: outer membrane lipoprotein-sorting protein [Spirochaetota bacterium]|nr:outer membrane lipoprotein-sorting protein [Spirochaetota bacterium]HPC39642.1 outer membrane lipoprotein-sorting protein [Spirochaetota bacterium]HPL15995.1 outer membrane lipoprotein-sorting protein [Spirochaetota bacterium]HQF07368.1 outer membrane lipoprotein-sorting protein [Spirochaetota bacterium]HQH99226.1 outer membrane lipoprotein-sorting protein [Spirochaetota bacterium]
MRFLKTTIIAALVFGCAVSVLAETAEEMGTRLMKTNDDQPIFQKVKGDATIKIYGSTGDLRFQKKLVMASYTEFIGTDRQKENYISTFLEPADDAGNSYMMFNYKYEPDIKYVYLKGIRKAKKVTGADKRLSFFGSDFSNGDIGKPDFTECTYRTLADTRMTFKGKDFDCYVIESLPKNDQIVRDTGYGRKVTYLEKKTLLTLKIEYYDENKIKTKELSLLSFITRNNVNGKKVYYTTGLEMKNVKRGTRTELLFSNMHFEEEANFTPNIFTVEYLTRKWW